MVRPGISPTEWLSSIPARSLALSPSLPMLPSTTIALPTVIGEAIMPSPDIIEEVSMASPIIIPVVPIRSPIIMGLARVTETGFPHRRQGGFREVTGCGVQGRRLADSGLGAGSLGAGQRHIISHKIMRYSIVEGVEQPCLRTEITKGPVSLENPRFQKGKIDFAPKFELQPGRGCAVRIHLKRRNP